MAISPVLDRTLHSHYKACALCPRCCRVDRTAGQIGFCGEGADVKIAAIGAHLGEEPLITGQKGSGTVFFSGCSLRCIFCQNHQISRGGMGKKWNLEKTVDRLVQLYEMTGVHNVNFVTPDHFFPHTVLMVRLLRDRGVHIPSVYNMSGYQSRESLRLIEHTADIYLPDFKYADPDLAWRLAGIGDYPQVALEALSEMVRQKGFLDSSLAVGRGKVPGVENKDHSDIAENGVLVRHLILPGRLRNSLRALDMLFIEFGADLPLSLMTQYVPVSPFPSGSPLNRRVTAGEFRTVLNRVEGLGFRRVLVQYPDRRTKDVHPFLPDFRSETPFNGNNAKGTDTVLWV